MSKENRATRRAAKPDYKHTELELAAITRFLRAKQTPRLKVSQDGGLQQTTTDHPHNSTGLVLLMDAIGTTDLDFLNYLLSQLVNAGSIGPKIDEPGINFMLSVVKSIKPRDQLEAMLAAQMAAIHIATMTFARRLAHIENIPQQDSAERAFNKLARTFAVQLEALKRYRTGGEQKVTVQYVTVGEGGQAIVGNVTQAQNQRRAKLAKSRASSLTSLAQETIPAHNVHEKPLAALPYSSKKK